MELRKRLRVEQPTKRARRQTVQSRNYQLYQCILNEMHPGMTPSELIRLIRVARAVVHV